MFSNLKRWVENQVSVSVTSRIQRVCVSYLLFLMVVTTRKKSLDEAARFSGLHKSLFSRFLATYSNIAAYTLDQLSKKQAKLFSKVLDNLAFLPWKVAIIIDATTQQRFTRHTSNSKRFNHGQGFIIGHQWTNIILVINGLIIPLPPIPFYSKKYCKEIGIKYKSEHILVIEYITNLKLEKYIGSYNPKDVVVLADSGYDDHRIENAIEKKHWKFIIALGKTRSVKTIDKYNNTPKSTDWTQVAAFFRSHRWLKWITIRILSNGGKKKRNVFRVRQIVVYLRNVGKVRLICSEIRNRPDGRRKYLACNDLRVTVRQILIGYKLRWAIELFHKEVKMNLGFQDVATSNFKSVSSHVHWVYCAYILLNSSPPGISPEVKGVIEKQRIIKEIVDSKEKSRIRQLLTQVNGVKKLKAELQEALQGF